MKFSVIDLIGRLVPIPIGKTAHIHNARLTCLMLIVQIGVFFSVLFVFVRNSMHLQILTPHGIVNSWGGFTGGVNSYDRLFHPSVLRDLNGEICMNRRNLDPTLSSSMATTTVAVEASWDPLVLHDLSETIRSYSFLWGETDVVRGNVNKGVAEYAFGGYICDPVEQTPFKDSKDEIYFPTYYKEYIKKRVEKNLWKEGRNNQTFSTSKNFDTQCAALKDTCITEGNICPVGGGDSGGSIDDVSSSSTIDVSSSSTIDVCKDDVLTSVNTCPGRFFTKSCFTNRTFVLESRIVDGGKVSPLRVQNLAAQYLQDPIASSCSCESETNVLIAGVTSQRLAFEHSFLVGEVRGSSSYSPDQTEGIDRSYSAILWNVLTRRTEVVKTSPLGWPVMSIIMISTIPDADRSGIGTFRDAKSMDHYVEYDCSHLKPGVEIPVEQNPGECRFYAFDGQTVRGDGLKKSYDGHVELPLREWVKIAGLETKHGTDQNGNPILDDNGNPVAETDFDDINARNDEICDNLLVSSRQLQKEQFHNDQLRSETESGSESGPRSLFFDEDFDNLDGTRNKRIGESDRELLSVYPPGKKRNCIPLRVSGLQLIVDIEYKDPHFHTEDPRYVLAKIYVSRVAGWTGRAADIDGLKDDGVQKKGIDGDTIIRESISRYYSGVKILFKTAKTSKYGASGNLVTIFTAIAVLSVYFKLGHVIICYFMLYFLGNLSRDYRQTVLEEVLIREEARKTVPVKILSAFAAYETLAKFHRKKQQHSFYSTNSHSERVSSHYDQAKGSPLSGRTTASGKMTGRSTGVRLSGRTTGSYTRARISGRDTEQIRDFCRKSAATQKARDSSEERTQDANGPRSANFPSQAQHNIESDQSLSRMRGIDPDQSLSRMRRNDADQSLSRMRSIDPDQSISMSSSTDHLSDVPKAGQQDQIDPKHVACKVVDIVTSDSSARQNEESVSEISIDQNSSAITDHYDQRHENNAVMTLLSALPSLHCKSCRTRMKGNNLPGNRSCSICTTSLSLVYGEFQQCHKCNGCVCRECHAESVENAKRKGIKHATAEDTTTSSFTAAVRNRYYDNSEAGTCFPVVSKDGVEKDSGTGVTIEWLEKTDPTFAAGIATAAANNVMGRVTSVRNGVRNKLALTSLGARGKLQTMNTLRLESVQSIKNAKSSGARLIMGKTKSSNNSYNSSLNSESVVVKSPMTREGIHTTQNSPNMGSPLDRGGVVFGIDVKELTPECGRGEKKKTCVRTSRKQYHKPMMCIRMKKQNVYPNKETIPEYDKPLEKEEERFEEVLEEGIHLTQDCTSEENRNTSMSEDSESLVDFTSPKSFPRPPTSGVPKSISGFDKPDVSKAYDISQKNNAEEKNKSKENHVVTTDAQKKGPSSTEKTQQESSSSTQAQHISSSSANASNKRDASSKEDASSKQVAGLFKVAARKGLAQQRFLESFLAQTLEEAANTKKNTDGNKVVSADSTEGNKNNNPLPDNNSGEIILKGSPKVATFLTKKTGDPTPLGGKSTILRKQGTTEQEKLERHRQKHLKPSENIEDAIEDVQLKMTAYHRLAQRLRQRQPISRATVLDVFTHIFFYGRQRLPYGTINALANEVAYTLTDEDLLETERELLETGGEEYDEECLYNVDLEKFVLSYIAHEKIDLPGIQAHYDPYRKRGFLERFFEPSLVDEETQSIFKKDSVEEERHKRRHREHERRRIEKMQGSKKSVGGKGDTHQHSVQHTLLSAIESPAIESEATHIASGKKS